MEHMQNINSQTLDNLKIGKKAKVLYIDSHGIEHRRFLDLGLVQGTVVEAIQKSPSGDPVAYLIRGALIAIRREDANKIVIEM